MPYDEDEARRAARARLERRMARRASSGSTAPTNARSGSADASRRPNPKPVSAPAPARLQGGSQQSASRGGRGARQTTQARGSSHQVPHIGIPQLDERGGGLLGMLSPRVIAIAAAAVVLLLVVVLFVVPRCSGQGASSDQGGQQSQTAQQSGQAASASASASQSSSGSNSASASASASESTSASESSDEGDASTSATATQAVKVDSKNEMHKALIDLIGEEDTQQLLTAAASDPDALWIAAHPDEFAFDGIEVQVKILKLAAHEPKAVSYVRSFPTQYPSSDASSDESIGIDAHSPSPDVPDTKTPHLYQWDRRWGNTVYSSTAFGLTGCGPTSLAMVYQGVTGKTDINPHDMAVMAEERGYMSEFQGTENAFFTEMAAELGMTCTELYPAAETLTDALSNGQVVIALLAPGLFTTTGHFFVLTGLTDDGQVILNDPYSYERSSQTWDAQTIAGEATTLYAYSA